MYKNSIKLENNTAFKLLFELYLAVAPNPNGFKYIEINITMHKLHRGSCLIGEMLKQKLV